jgi:two-component system sensor histidine kinase KdpD
VIAITFIAYRVTPVNATTVGFAYLLLVLIIASSWGFSTAFVVSCAATLTYNFFFLPPIGTFTIADPQNWIALFSFLATALISSRLSAKAEERTLEALERQRDLERLYTFSRAILLMEGAQPFMKEMVAQLASVFKFEAVVLYDARSDQFFRAGPSEFDYIDDKLRDVARQGTFYAEPAVNRVVTAVRLGTDPIASIALQGGPKQDSVIQGIANLIAIGLERARAEAMAQQIEAARQNEELRTTLIDALAHEFKTPLTSIKAATTALLASPEQHAENRKELLKVADEEADHLRQLVDDAVEMARLDMATIALNVEAVSLKPIVEEVVKGARDIADRKVTIVEDGPDRPVRLDQRLAKIALKQLFENALKYSPAGSPIRIRVFNGDEGSGIDVTDFGKGIPATEQHRIFERFYRSPSVRSVPGSGLGLTIANEIMHAHNGDLALWSKPGETTFRMLFPSSTGTDNL